MANVTEEQILNRVVYKALPPGEVFNAKMQPTRWLEQEGWQPIVDLETGIKRLWELIDAEEKEKQGSN